MKKLRPIIIDNSRIPGLLSKLAPIEIWAMVIWPWILCRERLADYPVGQRHELVHWQQYRELWVVGFLVLYLWDYLRGLRKHRNGRLAYISIRFEQEARHCSMTQDRFDNRTPFGWRKYSI